MGLDILKKQASNPQIMVKKIFEHDQVKLALVIVLGVSGPDEIEIVTDDAASKAYADKINDILMTA